MTMFISAISADIIVRCLSRYKYSILSGMIIIVALIASVCIFGELNPVIAAVGGLLFSIPIQFFWQSYMSPVLKIRGEPEIRRFHLGNEIRGEWEYKANRIIVENTGRSAAKNCKGYIVVKNSKERICWTVPKERPNATINAKDKEKLDFCAFYVSGPHGSPTVVGGGTQPPRIIAPTEEGWPTDPFKCRPLDGIEECEVLITADNADPVNRKVRFNIRKREIGINAK